MLVMVGRVPAAAGRGPCRGAWRTGRRRGGGRGRCRLCAAISHGGLTTSTMVPVPTAGTPSCMVIACPGRQLCQPAGTRGAKRTDPVTLGASSGACSTHTRATLRPGSPAAVCCPMSQRGRKIPLPGIAVIRPPSAGERNRSSARMIPWMLSHRPQRHHAAVSATRIRSAASTSRSHHWVVGCHPSYRSAIRRVIQGVLTGHP
jgi:hypothetical protein